MTKQQNNKLLTNDFIKSIARAFAYDLLQYSEHGGNMKKLTATNVHEFLEQHNRQVDK